MAEFVEKHINPFTYKPLGENIDEDRLKYYRDLKKSLYTAKEEGLGRVLALEMIKARESKERIIQFTELNDAQFELLIKKLIF